MEPFHTPISMPLPPYAFTSDITNSTNCSLMMTTPRMDARIWSRLPQRLIDRIIACLPPPAFFRARAVCKRWYGLLFSNAFLELYLQVSPRHHYFIFFRQQSLKNCIYRSNTTTTTDRIISSSTISDHRQQQQQHVQEGYLLDPDNLKWYRISFPLIPPGFSPASSSGGLMCWASDESGSKSILLSNPLTGAVVQLPSTLRPRLCPSVGLTITNSSIDLAVAGDDLISPYAVKNLTSESFHVDGGGFYSVWGTTASLPRLCSLESGRMVHVGGRFYCMNYSPFSVLAYDISRNEWGKIQAPMRRFLRSPSLVESRGKLILVAAVEKSRLNVPKSLRMWALEQQEGTWVEMERMPQQLYNQFAEMEGGRGFNCVGQGEVVVILMKGAAGKAVLFDGRRRRWGWVGACPYVDEGEEEEEEENQGELQGFAYEARLAAPITLLLQQLLTHHHLHPSTTATSTFNSSFTAQA